MNERLRSALSTRGVTLEALAAHVGVDGKTVVRWLLGRTPHPRHRWTTAVLLREDETYLWPDTNNPIRALTASSGELVCLYPRRPDVPKDLWWKLLMGARNHVDLLAYGAAFLPDQHPGWIDALRTKGESRCRVRIALGDPEHPVVIARGEDEQPGNGSTWISSRIRLAQVHYQALVGVQGVHVHVHGTPLYNSIYRFDDVMLVNAHAYTVPAYEAPVFHLRRLDGGMVFDTYLRSFEAAWAKSTPCVSCEEPSRLRAVS